MTKQKRNVEFAKMFIISQGSVQSIDGQGLCFANYRSAYQILAGHGSENEQWAAKKWLENNPA
jgi:hypothetical protein